MFARKKLPVAALTMCVAIWGWTASVEAFPFGAPAGYSGGPNGAWANCSACHEFSQGLGSATVQPSLVRFMPAREFDFTLEIGDPDQVGAGFEVSVEAGSAHVGTLSIVDAVVSQFSTGNSDYVTHTSAGVSDSLVEWAAGGQSYEYQVAWEAPGAPLERATLFLAGNAINDGSGPFGDHYYFGYARLVAAVPGDMDGDGDVDLADLAGLQRCFGAEGIAPGEACDYVDTNGDAVITLDDWPAVGTAIDGPVATDPPAYHAADAVRGGLLYDKWWKVNGAPEPVGNHPLYPPLPLQSGSTTYRCKECHGWDYLGVDGAYATGTHFTGIIGIAGTTKTAAEIVELLAAHPDDVENGHNMTAYGLDQTDLWDLARMTLEGVVSPDALIDDDGLFTGDSFNGSFLYQDVCLQCHGSLGEAIPVGDPVFLGAVATSNPWEFAHKVRFGHPASSMPPSELLELTVVDVADIGTYAQTLPTE